MAFALPNVSYLGYPVSVLCPAHAGLGVREARPTDAAAIVEHFRTLDPADRRMRFCATLNDGAIERHVTGIWERRSLVLAAFDGPLWQGPFHRAAPIRALAELALDASEAELGISVDAELRRRGIGVRLVETAGNLLAARGIRRIRACTLPDNRAFVALAQGCGATLESGPGEIEAVFDTALLRRAYHRRRAAEMLRPAA
jgi:GNAT superfamily N-acetyltransferase